MQLHSFFNSSNSYRVRIALALKGLTYDTLPVNIRIGEHRATDYVANVNPSASVPALIDGEFSLGQSLAILDYLDRKFPEPRLIPLEPERRARVLELATAISCDIHPINNLRVLRYLQRPLGHDHAAIETWYNHWIAEGFAALERLLAGDDRTGRFCHGDRPGLADIALVPQVVNSERYRLDLGPYPTITRIFETCMTLDAFAAAHPQQQPDREE